MKKLLAMFMITLVLAIASCGNGSQTNDPPTNGPDIDKLFIWGQSKWGDANWNQNNNEEG